MKGDSNAYCPGPEGSNAWGEIDRSPAIRVEEAAELARRGEKVVGLNLALCVLDIVSGEVPYNSVVLVYPGTMIETPEDWEDVLHSYSEAYWYKNPEECLKVARKFAEDGKLYRPRVMEESALFTVREKHWLRKEDERRYIEWPGREPK